MDEAGIEAKGTAPLKPVLDSIGGIKDKSDVPAVLGGLHRAGVNVFFGFGSEPDFKDSKIDIATADQGGLSLPDRDYYFKDDAKSVELRQKFEQHVAKMFELYGEPLGEGRGRRQDRDEGGNRPRQGSLDRTEQRDPNKIYHKMSVADLQKLSPLSPGTSTSPASSRPHSTASTSPCPTS